MISLYQLVNSVVQMYLEVIWHYCIATEHLQTRIALYKPKAKACKEIFQKILPKTKTQHSFSAKHILIVHSIAKVYTRGHYMVVALTSMSQEQIPN